jgi:hypothetical protein
MLICKYCNLEKDLNEFDSFGQSKSWSKGRVCRICKKDIKRKNNAIRYEKTKDINKESKLQRNRKWHTENKEKVRLRNKSWQENNRDKVKHNTLMSAHGISYEKYKEMLQRQDGVCAICKKKECKIVKKTGRVKSLCVDHSHENGNIRGLLCDDCNVAIGKFKEDIGSLKNAIEYLENSSKEIKC